MYCLMMCIKIAGCVIDNVDLDQMQHSAASDLGLHCLLRPVCPNTKCYYGTCDSFANCSSPELKAWGELL